MPNEKAEQWIVTAAWKARVRRELASRGRGAQAAMARAIGASTSLVSDLLGPRCRRSHLVPRVHRFFNWEPPPVANAGNDGSHRVLLERASEEQRQAIEFLVDLVLRKPDADETRAILGMIAAFRTLTERDHLVHVSKVIAMDADVKHLQEIERAINGAEDIDLITIDSAIDGVLRVGTFQPLLVVVDEKLDGLEVCRRIKEHPDTAHVTVVISCVAPSKRLEQAANRVGAHRVVPKPVDVRKLVAELRE